MFSQRKLLLQTLKSFIKKHKTFLWKYREWVVPVANSYHDKNSRDDKKLVFKFGKYIYHRYIYISRPPCERNRQTDVQIVNWKNNQWVEKKGERDCSHLSVSHKKAKLKKRSKNKARHGTVDLNRWPQHNLDYSSKQNKLDWK